MLPDNYVDSLEYRARGAGFTSWAGRPYRLDQYGNAYFKCKTCHWWKPASSRFFRKVGNHCITRYNLRQNCKGCVDRRKGDVGDNRGVKSKKEGHMIYIVLKHKKSCDAYEYRGAFSAKSDAIARARELARKEDFVYQTTGKMVLFTVIADRLRKGITSD